MLDAFLAVAYDHELRQSESVKLANVLSALPEEDLRKLASGEAKLSFAECSPTKEGETWLDRFKGTPLFDQAMALEKSDLEAEVARTQAQAAAPPWDSINKTQDQIRVQKKMLELDLVELQNGGAAPPTKGPEQPMAVLPNDEAQGAGAMGDAGPDAEAPKVASAKQVRESDAAIQMTESDKKRVIKGDQPIWGSAGGLAGTAGGTGVGYLAGRGVSSMMAGNTPASAGLKAGLPFFGAAMGALPGAVLGHEVQRRHHDSKEASAFMKAAISGGLIDKAVVNTVAKGALTPARAAKAKALGDKLVSKGSKMVGDFGRGGQIAGGQAGKGLALARQGAHMSDLMGKLGSNMLGAALSIAKKNPKLVGAGIGAGVGALAGGKDNRLGGALAGAGLGAAGGAAATGIGARMAGPGGKGFTDAAGGYVKDLATKAKGMIGKGVDPAQYAVTPKPALPAGAPVQAHAGRALDALDAARGRAMPANMPLPGKNNVQLMKAAARFFNAAQALEA